MPKQQLRLRVSKNDGSLGYLYLPNHPNNASDDIKPCVTKMIALYDLIGEYEGPSVYLDFKENELIGIEIVP